MNTCVGIGDEEPISHPFKPYTRERFPGAVIPPTNTERAATEAAAQQKQQQQPQSQQQPQQQQQYQQQFQQPQPQYAPALQSVGSNGLVAPVAPSLSSYADAYPGTMMPQQAQLYQQLQQHSVPGTYYQQPAEMLSGGSGSDAQSYYSYYPQQYQQQYQMQQQPQIQLQQPMYTAEQYGASFTPYYYYTYPPPVAASVPTATAAEVPDPNRPTYVQNVIGLELAKRERINALLSTRQR